MNDYLDKTKYVLITAGVLLLLLMVGKHYYPGMKNILGFIWWSVLSLVFLFPIYYHKKAQLPCMIKIEELEGIRSDVEKIKSKIILERIVSIFSFLLGMMMATVYLIYA
jgi:hypothetical protein